MFKKILTVCLLCCAMGAGFAQAEEKTTIKAISGPVSGPWYVGMGLVGKAITNVYPEFRIEMLPGGALANPMRLSAGDGQIALGTTSISNAAREGFPPYKKPVGKVKGLLNIGDPARLHILVRSDLGINSIEDIVAKKPALRVAYGPKSAATWVAEWLFAQYNFGYDDMVKWGGKIYANNYDDVVNMARDKQVDMLIWLGPGEAWFIGEITKNVEMKFLPVTGAAADAISKKHNMEKGFIPAAFYSGVPGSDIPTLYATTEILAQESMSDDTAYKLVRAICEQHKDIAQGNAQWATFVPETAWKGVSYPLHPGAEKYYRERGWIK